jgi:hypothetical protein
MKGIYTTFFRMDFDLFYVIIVIFESQFMENA